MRAGYEGGNQGKERREVEWEPVSCWDWVKAALLEERLVSTEWILG